MDLHSHECLPFKGGVPCEHCGQVVSEVCHSAGHQMECRGEITDEDLRYLKFKGQALSGLESDILSKMDLLREATLRYKMLKD